MWHESFTCVKKNSFTAMPQLKVSCPTFLAFRAMISLTFAAVSLGFRYRMSAASPATCRQATPHCMASCWR